MLRLVPEADVAVIERCSGHGGAWGYKKENFETALKVGKPVARQAAGSGKSLYRLRMSALRRAYRAGHGAARRRRRKSPSCSPIRSSCSRAPMAGSDNRFSPFAAGSRVRSLERRLAVPLVAAARGPSPGSPRERRRARPSKNWSDRHGAEARHHRRRYSSAGRTTPRSASRAAGASPRASAIAASRSGRSSPFISRISRRSGCRSRR